MRICLVVSVSIIALLLAGCGKREKAPEPQAAVEEQVPEPISFVEEDGSTPKRNWEIPEHDGVAANDIQYADIKQVVADARSNGIEALAQDDQDVLVAAGE